MLFIRSQEPSLLSFSEKSISIVGAIVTEVYGSHIIASHAEASRIGFISVCESMNSERLIWLAGSEFCGS